jgi:hypothetical protein
MTQAIALDSKEIWEIFHPRTVNSARLWEIAQKANALAVAVEQDWEELPEDRRKLLTTLAYAGSEPPPGIQWKLRNFIDRLFAVGMLLKDFNACAFYVEASERLLDAIFSGIERENEDYQAALSAALTETSANVESSKAMTAEEACERIREISDEVSRDI